MSLVSFPIANDATGSSLVLKFPSLATLEVSLFELSGGPFPSANQFGRHFAAPGPAGAPQMEVVANGAVVSTVAACAPITGLESSGFVSLGLAIEGVDVAYALPAATETMGAVWSYDGNAEWAATTIALH
jgi:hypothetical protein